MKTDLIRAIDVHLVSMPVAGGLTDATRKVEEIGFLIVRVHTQQGREGIGVTYHEVGGEATRELIIRNMVPRLLGRDPLQTEALWWEFFHYLRGVGRKGLMYCALSAIDIALWDLKGKFFDLPLYRLLGGNKTAVPVYASGGWTSYDDDQLVAEMANRIRDYDITLFEEPVFADDILGLSRFRRGTDIPLATGEHEYTKFGVRDLLLNEAADIVQADGARAGGYTEMLKIAALTQAWNVKFAPHAMENIHLNLMAALPNGFMLERLLMFEDLTQSVFKNPPVPVDGMMHVPDLPGLGLNLDMDFIRSEGR